MSRSAIPRRSALPDARQLADLLQGLLLAVPRSRLAGFSFECLPGVVEQPAFPLVDHVGVDLVPTGGSGDRISFLNGLLGGLRLESWAVFRAGFLYFGDSFTSFERRLNTSLATGAKTGAHLSHDLPSPSRIPSTAASFRSRRCCPKSPPIASAVGFNNRSG